MKTDFRMLFCRNYGNCTDRTIPSDLLSILYRFCGQFLITFRNPIISEAEPLRTTGSTHATPYAKRLIHIAFHKKPLLKTYKKP